MQCPICGNRTNNTHKETISRMNKFPCEERYKCDCGYYYEFTYGAERETYKERQINKWNIRLLRLIYKIRNIGGDKQ